ncbi:MAG: dTDP-glucose 4,6-dehydratase [candidate division Zixibacteria bacterium]|nr:dTDP-glucose 4,6-dehydratase [candidate division Zixibacteria bacterium]
MTGRDRTVNRSFLVCGGCGFIGSNFTRSLRLRYPEAAITVVDLLTYAGSLDNLGDFVDTAGFEFVKADISEFDTFTQFASRAYDLVINFAAETHVDRSLYQPDIFARTNVLGVVNLLLFCRDRNIPFLQISTDEVYGPARADESFSEAAPLRPTSPYAASKAAADLMVEAAISTFDQPAAIVRTSNNYGRWQFPEKLIPYFIYLARQNKPLPLYGDGSQRRCWIHVEDFCEALLRVVADFPTGEVYNIGGANELTNLEVAESLLRKIGGKSEVKLVPDRPGHDRAYRIDSSKYEAHYGSIKSRDFAAGLAETIDWYLAHSDIFARLDTAESRQFLDKHYRKHS